MEVDQYCLKTSFLVKVLHLINSDAKPAMGSIHNAINRVKEQIDKNFNHVSSSYSKIWKIMDESWNLQLHRLLHAATYFLNPSK